MIDFVGGRERGDFLLFCGWYVLLILLLGLGIWGWGGFVLLND